METTPRFTGQMKDNSGSDSELENNSFTLFNNLYGGTNPEKKVKHKAPKEKQPKPTQQPKDPQYAGLSYFTFNEVIFSKISNIGSKNLEESMPSIYNEISKDAKAKRQQYPQSLFDVPTKDLLYKYMANNQYDENRNTPQGSNTNPGRGESLYSTTSIDNDNQVDYYSAATPPQNKGQNPHKVKRNKENNKFNGDMYCGFLPAMEASPNQPPEKIKVKEPEPIAPKKAPIQNPANYNNYLPSMNQTPVPISSINPKAQMPKTSTGFRPASKQIPNNMNTITASTTTHTSNTRGSTDFSNTFTQGFDRVLGKKNSSAKINSISDMKKVYETSPPRRLQKLSETTASGKPNHLNSSFEEKANQAINHAENGTLEPHAQPKVKIDTRPNTTAMDVRRPKDRTTTLSGSESRKIIKENNIGPQHTREKTMERSVDKKIERPPIEKPQDRNLEKSIDKKAHERVDKTPERTGEKVTPEKKNDSIVAEKIAEKTLGDSKTLETQGVENKLANSTLVNQKPRPKSPPKQMYQPKNNMDKIEQTIKFKGGIDHNSDMAQYLRKRGLKENTKIFSFNSRDEHIKRALKKLGWVENPTQGSFLFDFKWSYTDVEADYNLMEGQYFNHFLNNREITTKSGLINNLKHSTQSGIDIWQFFPRAYDLGHVSELKEFREDFERTALITLLKNHWNLFIKKSDPKLIEKIKKKLIEKPPKKKSDLPIKRKYKEYHYTHTPKVKDFVVQMRVMEVALNCARALVQNYKDLGEESHFKTFDQLNPKTQHMLLNYSKLQHLEKLTQQEKNKVGGNDSDWETPNETLIYKVYKFLQYFKRYIPQCDIDGVSNLWIIKPSGNSRGSGIFLVDNLESALDSGAKNQARIVQKYIENPLIIRDFPLDFVNHKKFDIRQWVLVSSLSPLKIHLFSSSYMRICSSNFDLSDIKDNLKHLTNFSLNKTNFKNNLEESICETDLLKKYLKVKRNIDWDVEIRPKIVEIVTNTLVCTAEKLEDRPGCFELYGFDLLLDDKCNPWLLEVNLSPACSERVGWLTEMLDDMADGLLKLVLPPNYLVPIKEETESKPSTATPDKTRSSVEQAIRVDDNPRKEDEAEVEANKVLRYSWDLIYEGESNYDAANINPLLEVVGTKINIKKEKELDRKFYSHVASICIQKNIRMFICKRRKLRLKEKKMATRIQTRARVCLAKNELQRRKEKRAALVIEDVMRIVQAIKIKRELKRKKAATKIQSHVRKFHCIKLRKKLAYIKKIIKIQSWWRMIRAIKAKLKLRTRKVLIIRIQRFWKKYFRALVKKTIKVQSIARVIKAKNLLKKERKRKKCAILIQKTVRMFFAKLVRKELFFQKQALKLKTKFLLESKKRFIRGLLVNRRNSKFCDNLKNVLIRQCFKTIKDRAEKRNKAAKVIQGLCKIRKAKRKLRRLKRVKASKKIQSIWRMLRQRRLFRRTVSLKYAAIIIQKNYRMILARRKFQEMMNKLELEKYTKLVREQLEEERRKKEQDRKNLQLKKIQKQLELQAKQKDHINYIAQPPGMRPYSRPRDKKSLPLQPKDVLPTNSLSTTNGTLTTAANTVLTTIGMNSKPSSNVVSGKPSQTNLHANTINPQKPTQPPKKDPYEILNNIYLRKQNIVQVKAKPNTAQQQPQKTGQHLKDISEIQRYEDTNFDALYNIFAKKNSKFY